MKRAGFTMIELIFVIVILGILSAVALPKFIGVSEQAQVGKVKAYVGTLNRTVAPSLWAKSLSLGEIGKITGTSSTTFDTDMQAAMEDLEDIIDGGGDVGTSSFVALAATTCVPYVAGSGTDLSTLKIGDTVTKGAMQVDATIGGVNYSIGCIDGTNSQAPRFYLSQEVGAADKLLVK